MVRMNAQMKGLELHLRTVLDGAVLDGLRGRHSLLLID